MNDKKIISTIAKYLNNEANYDDLTKLNFWLHKIENQNLFKSFVKTEYLINLSMSEFDFNKITNQIKEKKKIISRKQRVLKFSKYAAAAVVLAVISATSYFYYSANSMENTTINASNQFIFISPGSNKAVLTLENGNQVELDEEKKFQNGYSKSNGKSIVYNNTKIKEATVYNYITVPRGGQFQLQLSDGTKVWMNSDSKLKYPTQFQKGEIREVELVYGEVYFDVSESYKNEGAKFKVKTGIQDVEVLGTEFNIQAYTDDDKVLTTLVEGKVKVFNAFTSRYLTPGQQSNSNIKTDALSVYSVDVATQIAWRNGVFLFKRERLESIMEKLARWYQFDIVFEDEAKKQLKFSGKLKMSDNISQLLNIIEDTGGVSFQQKNNAIHIK
ncbi:FecR family protein [uncultured Algibacter sp.]|uniref:FecR family protein n=1 Tax=uncultured Algibacter sp. TaxID=298659 RepID=UPI003216BE80